MQLFLAPWLCHIHDQVGLVKSSGGVDAEVVEVEGDLHHRLVAPRVGQVSHHLPCLVHLVPGEDVRELRVVLLVAADQVEDTVDTSTSCLEPSKLSENISVPVKPERREAARCSPTAPI